MKKKASLNGAVLFLRTEISMALASSKKEERKAASVKYFVFNGNRKGND